MASINPPWRFDPLQMIVNVSFGGGGCIVTTKVNQVFYSADGTEWKEFDFTLNADQGGSGTDAIFNVIYDAISKKFFISTSSADFSASVFVSQTGAAWSVSGGFYEWSEGNPTLIDYPLTGLLNAPDVGSGDNGTWSINGGNTWNQVDPIPFNDWNGGNALFYPAPIWKGLYVQGLNLCDVDNNVISTVNPPSGFELITLTAGNGLLVGIFQSGTDYILGVSSNNSSWTTTREVGTIPSYTPSAGSDFPDSFNPNPYAPGNNNSFPNFGLAQLTFVPAWNKFVFAGNMAVQAPYGVWVSGPSSGPDGEDTPVLETQISLIAAPVQIYTSSDGITWRQVFQADYTNGTAAAITTPQTTGTVFDLYIATGLTDTSFPNDGVDSGTGYLLYGFTDGVLDPDTVAAAAGQGATLSGSPGNVTISGAINPANNGTWVGPYVGSNYSGFFQGGYAVNTGQDMSALGIAGAIPLINPSH